MAQTSRFSAAFCRLVIVGLLAGCGPLVAERDDDFIEEQCELSCDRFDECGLGFGDCMDVCAELVASRASVRRRWIPRSAQIARSDPLTYAAPRST